MKLYTLKGFRRVIDIGNYTETKNRVVVLNSEYYRRKKRIITQKNKYSFQSVK